MTRALLAAAGLALAAGCWATARILHGLASSADACCRLVHDLTADAHPGTRTVGPDDDSDLGALARQVGVLRGRPARVRTFTHAERLRYCDRAIATAHDPDEVDAYLDVRLDLMPHPDPQENQ